MQCIVFNTTEQLDIAHMTRLLMGIASTGAWSCFDEFNRLDMEVLSVVAKQILTIQTALGAGEFGGQPGGAGTWESGN
jgi:dynein heavy chain